MFQVQSEMSNLREKLQDVLWVARNKSWSHRKSIICDEVDRRAEQRDNFNAYLTPIAEEAETLKKRLLPVPDTELEVPKKICKRECSGKRRKRSFSMMMNFHEGGVNCLNEYYSPSYGVKYSRIVAVD
ncbi:hypothetical protein RUM43_012182 [Polyplax serrata]|uniref:Uncharacterized protein n=1 Tax=Polyplax serrata TaxID=468196 RepID=A0AAN8NWT6_POLSC